MPLLDDSDESVYSGLLHGLGGQDVVNKFIYLVLNGNCKEPYLTKRQASHLRSAGAKVKVKTGRRKLWDGWSYRSTDLLMGSTNLDTIERILLGELYPIFAHYRDDLTEIRSLFDNAIDTYVQRYVEGPLRKPELSESVVVNLGTLYKFGTVYSEGICFPWDNEIIAELPFESFAYDEAALALAIACWCCDAKKKYSFQELKYAYDDGCGGVFTGLTLKCPAVKRKQIHKPSL